MTTYHYKDSGLTNIYLKGGFVVLDSEYGEAVSIHNLKGLHRAIGLDIVHKAPTLSGDEVRFLRKEMNLTQNALAASFDVSEDTIRGWESNRTPISPTADKLLRWLYLEDVDGDGTLHQLIEDIARLDREIAENQRRMNFDEKDGAWQIAEAA